jgi:hypothetical protein
MHSGGRKVDRNVEPVKWLKYLLLVEFELTSLRGLQEQIHRTPWQSRWQLFDDLSARLPPSGATPSEFTVVKLVTTHSVGQLENIRLATRQSLSKLRRAFNEKRTDIAEVWDCRTRVGPALLSVAGRLAVSAKLEPFGQCLEQVWQCSPRMLEERGPNFKFPYARATRDGWGRSYRIDEVYLPAGWRRRAAAVRREFADSMVTLERMRSRIESLAEFIEAAHISSYSFEYKIVGGQLSIIDWDTSNDWEVLRNASRIGFLPVLY